MNRLRNFTFLVFIVIMIASCDNSKPAIIQAMNQSETIKTVDIDRHINIDDCTLILEKIETIHSEASLWPEKEAYSDLVGYRLCISVYINDNVDYFHEDTLPFDIETISFKDSNGKYTVPSIMFQESKIQEVNSDLLTFVNYCFLSNDFEINDVHVVSYQIAKIDDRKNLHSVDINLFD